jgi:hypothetical protein
VNSGKRASPQVDPVKYSQRFQNSMDSDSKETPMFVRKVMALLKPNSISKFSLLMEQEVIPMLRTEKGFQDELAFFAPGEDAVTTITLWDKASSAEAYSHGTYPEVLKKLAALIEGTPKVDTYELVNSTFHKIAAAS